MKILLVWMAGPLLFAQQGVTVRGTVVNAVSQETLNKVIVTLNSTGGPNGLSFATESAGGRFTIEHVRPGKYIVTAQRDGFTREAEGAPGVPPPQVLVEGGKDLNVVVRMQPLCVIGGRVTDSDGDPLRSVNVTAMRYGYAGGKRQLNSAVSAMTDDRGDYRLFGLPPGRYFVRAAGSQRFLSTDLHAINAATYFPGTTEATEAGAVNVAAGGEARGIDIALRRETVFKVRGTLPSVPTVVELPTSPQIQFLNRGMHGAFNLQLIPASPQGVAVGFPLSMSEQNGTTRFEFADVPSGAYVLTAMKTEEGHSTYARETVQVAGGDVDGLNLTLAPALDVTGKVIWEGEAAGKFEGMRVRLGPPAGRRGGVVPLTPLKEDGTFVIHDVPPDTFEVMVNGPATTYLKSVQVGVKPVDGREVDFTRGSGTLTIVLASDVGDVSGTVKDEKGLAAARVRVTAIPVGANLGRMDNSRFAFTNGEGKFEIQKLAPGDYKIFAWDNVEVGAPQDPEFRKPYEKQGREIRLSSNGRQTVDLTVIHVAER